MQRWGDQLTSSPSGKPVALITLVKARELLNKYYPEQIFGLDKLVPGLAAGTVPYQPNNPDLHELWTKLSKGNPNVEHVRIEGDWAEFYLAGKRCTIGPIQVGHEAVVALLPKAARERLVEKQEESAKERPRHVTAKEWITAEARQLKRTDKIPVDIERGRRGAKKKFAQLLATNILNAVKKDRSITPVTWKYINNHLLAWGLWPISAIE
jgi:hypothetical protein